MRVRAARPGPDAPDVRQSPLARARIAGRRVLAGAAALVTVACAAHPPATGLSLAAELETATQAARGRLAAHDISCALRLPVAASQRTARSPGRDLVHGHIGALDGEATVLGDLAALRAATGDTAGARAAFDRPIFLNGSYPLLDSLERSPMYGALNATTAAPRWRQTLRQLRRTSAFVSPYRDTIPLKDRVHFQPEHMSYTRDRQWENQHQYTHNEVPAC